ncbi:hsp20-like protein [Diaporthe amygdali]|uniref:hsp20-like protein n=1 Tax=Phomopsis amygdali TaxID=1214568 RepID=UPI0022FF047B|nr:hsp20-like protein [Diaporthe amygdali]KAJ0121692.1 hsp20-like protein [Diaporthe amygdali]
MAWPGNFNWNMQDNTGAGVDRAPPAPFGPPFTNPEFWQRWAQSRGWEDWNSEPWGPGPHGRHGHGFGRRGRGHGPRGGPGGPGGRHRRGGSDDHTPEGSDNEAFPPEYITDDEVAAAVAEGEKNNEKEKDRAEMDVDSPDTMARDEPGADDPPEEVPDETPGRRQRGCGHRGRRGRGGFGAHDHHHRGSRHRGPPGPPPFFGGFFGGPQGPHGPPPPFPPFLAGLFGPGPHGPGPHGHPHHPPPPPPPPHGPQPPHGREGPGAGFDFGPWAAAVAGHPFAQRMREFLERAQGANDNNNRTRGAGEEADDSSFTPPVDLFEQPDRWVLHFAVPGARKEDVGVNWDADRSVLSVSGVVHRPGDEDFIKGLINGERSVGLFSRDVGLPPAGQDRGDSKEEVNAEGIVAKMEDGILVVTVPKVERGWTEVRKVDIA